MELKSVGLAVVTAHTSIRLQIKELPVLIVRTDGVVDVTAQARFNAKNVCSRNVFGRGVSKCAPPLIFYEAKIVGLSTTGVNNVEAQGTGIKIADKSIVVSTAKGEKVAVYNAKGLQVYSATAAQEATIALSAPGVYIVKVGNKALTVCIK